MLHGRGVTLLKHSRAWHLFLAFVGWMLSPLTWWNDAFVNIPIAYALASVVAWVWPKSFLVAFLVFYWATNFLGSWLLLLGGRELIKPAMRPARRWLLNLLITLYCIFMSVLILKDIVHPIPFPRHEP